VGSRTLSEARFSRQRRRLVERIADHGITDVAILRAFDTVPRHAFLPAAVQHRAYEDLPLPIGFGQTASQPSLQALYMEVLDLKQSDRVLEIGTGSGFQTAVLAELAGHVYSVERIMELAARARTTIETRRTSNVAFLVGDGSVGWSRYAPYDAILVAAAAPKEPVALIDQLAPGGRLLVPIGDRRQQRLTLFRNVDGGVETEEVTAVSFVPLVGRFGWPA
jgi:protein-L-isoaspartate(D-aspartate) O-methyltransferase